MKFLRLILLLTLVFGGIWFGGLVWFKSQIAAQATSNEQHTDAIIVLTGGSLRLKEGLRLLENNMGGRLFVSGAGKGVTKADLYSSTKVALPEDKTLLDRIEIGYDANDTEGNALEVSQWISGKEYRSIRLVTSNYHMMRSSLLFENMNMNNVIVIKHPVVSENVVLDQWWKYKGSRDLIISEYNKFLAVTFNIAMQKRR